MTTETSDALSLGGRHFSGAGETCLHALARFLQPANRVFTTCQPNANIRLAGCVNNLPPPFLWCSTPCFYVSNADLFYIARCTHVVSVTPGKPWPSQATPRPRVDCYCHDWPAEQPRDRGLIVIVTIGQPSTAGLLSRLAH